MKKVTAVLIAIAFICLTFPYLVVEINTAIYKDALKDLYIQSDEEISNDNYCKVFYKTNDKAKVFYATEKGAFFCYFTLINNQYVHNKTDILWAKDLNGGEQIYYPFYPIKDIKNYSADYY